jgi:flagellar hook-associated protein 2
MAGMSLSTGLISGMDTGSLITQLMQVEANPQTLLKTKLTATRADAAAYRAVNTRFDALRTAAEALTKTASWSTTKASSSASTVTASSGSSALPGALSFTVTQLASTHSMISQPGTEWADTAASFGAGTITITGPKGSKAVTVDTNGDGTGTLAEAITAINASEQGVTAAAVQVSPGKYRLQITSTGTGEANRFSLSTDTSMTFGSVTTGKDAVLTVGTDTPYEVRSSSNTFTGLLPDTTITVSQLSTTTPVTVSVASDPDAVASKVSSLINAANGVLSTIDSYTASDSDTATLKGDSTLRGLASQILSAVSSAIGADGSPAQAGLQLKRDGTIVFDSAVFTAKLKSDPAMAQRFFAGTPASLGADEVAGGTDDVAAVTGIAGRLFAIGKNASDTTTGTLTLLATSEDSQAKDLTARIEDWDLRLALRKQTLTRQFTAMETALGTLQTQSTWLTSQLSSLPSWSQSSK